MHPGIDKCSALASENASGARALRQRLNTSHSFGISWPFGPSCRFTTAHTKLPARIGWHVARELARSLDSTTKSPTGPCDA